MPPTGAARRAASPKRSEFAARVKRSKYRFVDRKIILNIERVTGKKKTPSPVVEQPKELWPGKRSATEDVTDFFRRVWKPYLAKGLTLIHIRDKDPKLYNAIRSYEVTTGEPWPADIALPTEKSRLSRAEERLRQEGPQALSPRELIAVGRRLARLTKPAP